MFSSGEASLTSIAFSWILIRGQSQIDGRSAFSRADNAERVFRGSCIADFQIAVRNRDEVAGLTSSPDKFGIEHAN
jgi:hypothetical protein